MTYLSGTFSETDQNDTAELRQYFYGDNDSLEYNGTLLIENGTLTNQDVTLMHNRSIAEDSIYFVNGTNDRFSGEIRVSNGKIEGIGDFKIEGKSLLIGADLTGKAFTRSIFGEYGQYIVAIGLLLFAFSTVIAWSYYGDRATAHLFGEGWILYYRIIYVGAFFLAAIIDTKIVWDIATVIGPIATIPNLLALILLRKEMKQIDENYKIVKNP